MTAWNGTSEMPPPPDFFSMEEMPALTRRDRKLDRIPLSPAHRRLRVVTTSLATVLVIALAAIGFLVADYRQQNQALTQCFASADANYWTVLAGMYKSKGEDSDAKYAMSQAKRALDPLGQSDIETAMRACTAQFYGTGLR